MTGLAIGMRFHSKYINVYSYTLTRRTMGHDIRLSSSNDFTKLLCCIISQPWGNSEFVPKLTMTLTYKWDPKMIIDSIWIGLLLMEVGIFSIEVS